MDPFWRTLLESPTTLNWERETESLLLKPHLRARLKENTKESKHLQISINLRGKLELFSIEDWKPIRQLIEKDLSRWIRLSLLKMSMNIYATMNNLCNFRNQSILFLFKNGSNMSISIHGLTEASFWKTL